MSNWNKEDALTFIGDYGLQGESVSSVSEVVKNAELNETQKALVYVCLGFENDARDLFAEIRSQLGLDFYVNHSYLMDSEMYDYLLDYSVREYITLKKSQDPKLEDIASNIISQKIQSVGMDEKFSIITAICGEEIKAKAEGDIVDAGDVFYNLIKEIGAFVKNKDEKYKMACEYAEEEFNVRLEHDDDSLFWIIDATGEEPEHSIVETLASSVTAMVKNFMGRPKERAIATAAIALSIFAASISSAEAAPKSKHYNMDEVKEFVTEIGDHFNNEILPNLKGANAKCRTKTKVLSESKNSISVEIKVGTKRILVDVSSSKAQGGGGFKASQDHSKVSMVGGDVNNGCNLTAEAYKTLAKVIGKGIENLKE